MLFPTTHNNHSTSMKEKLANMKNESQKVYSIIQQVPTRWNSMRCVPLNPCYNDINKKTMSLNLVKMMKNFKKYSTTYWVWDIRKRNSSDKEEIRWSNGQIKDHFCPKML
ncbi:hypothetical protein BpHYR1_038924 [Brachionus plicatilis]|uniref:Uncharacterized protein n=1 Tax=Brachionus plicatilis TaxID=10195 RepID=A0A3M7S000_BRAPC|nr:hypothetical protein BpHYR1_038924 [Brachionus plicatilis]